MLNVEIALVIAIPFTAQAPSTGSLRGCVADTLGQRLPGAVVVAKGDGAFRTTVTTDAAGCYEVTRLAPSRYRVTARLVGFDNATRDGVVAAAGTVTRVDFSLCLSTVCECIAVQAPATLAEAGTRADAILHVRLSESAGKAPSPSAYYPHLATVLHVFKRHPRGGPAGTTALLLEHQGSVSMAPAQPPHDQGQELVTFARWVPHLKGFVGLGTNCCNDPEFVLLLRDGRVEAAPAGFPRYVGMPVGTLFEELHALSARRSAKRRGPRTSGRAKRRF